MGYGVGQGLQQGVQMAGGFIMPAMQMRQQQKQFDASMGQRKDEMAQREKLFHDRLSMEQGWKEGFYGTPSAFGEPEAPAALPPDAFPRVPAAPAPRPAAPQAAAPPAAAPQAPSAPTPAQALIPSVRRMQGPQFLPPASEMKPKFSMPGMRPRRY